MDDEQKDFMPEFDDFGFSNMTPTFDLEADEYGTGEPGFFTEKFTFDQEAADEYSSSISKDSFENYRVQKDFFSDSSIQKNLPKSQISSPSGFGVLPVQRKFGYSTQNRFAFSTGPTKQPIGIRPINPLPAQLSLNAMEVFHPRLKQAKQIEPWVSSTPIAARTDPIFNDIIINRKYTINPTQVGFIPSMFWPSKEYQLADIIFDFFQRKNNVSCRFLHKLYNAVKLSRVNDFYAELVGVKFITQVVLKVNKGCFARLLGIKTIDGSLFHKQGNFPNYGFVELSSELAQAYCTASDLADVDFDEVRLLIHTNGVFKANCTEADIYNYQQRPKK